ncbi:hypothetical protein LCGC14_0496950 [marine sediment metagenome]|uniref:Uncharacterized protein n=1 Tax=marine sediment metagenome TaxID=412755 RepID=A0A0F9SNH4_9ZZZZ
MKEFRVNDLICLRLIDNKTILYFNNEEFKQCKYLLLNIVKDEIENFQEIRSIDKAAENLDASMEYENKDILDPEVEFMGHCSNLQAWAENGYDSTLLHRNLAFPLLKTLAKEGDILAKQRFKEEIARRYKYGNYRVQAFLFEEGYLSYLTDAETGMISPGVIKFNCEIC